MKALKPLIVIFILLGSILLCSCGQYGDLYLPQQKKTTHKIKKQETQQKEQVKQE